MVVLEKYNKYETIKEFLEDLKNDDIEFIYQNKYYYIDMHGEKIIFYEKNNVDETLQEFKNSKILLNKCKIEDQYLKNILFDIHRIY